MEQEVAKYILQDVNIEESLLTNSIMSQKWKCFGKVNIMEGAVTECRAPVWKDMAQPAQRCTRKQTLWAWKCETGKLAWNWECFPRLWWEQCSANSMLNGTDHFFTCQICCLLLPLCFKLWTHHWSLCCWIAQSSFQFPFLSGYYHLKHKRMLRSSEETSTDI